MMSLLAAALVSLLSVQGTASRQGPAGSQMPSSNAQSLALAGALPVQVRAMIDAAIASGDKRSVETVLRFARQANPAAGAEIDEIAKRFHGEIAAREAAAAQLAATESDGILDHWKGQIELGASRSTGRSRSLGVFGSVELTRERAEWRHKLSGRIDYQSSGDVTSVDRSTLSYQPNYKVSSRFYGFGLLQHEHDRFAGYGERSTFGAGFGYGVLAQDDLDLDLEGGPTFRTTDPQEGDGTSQLVGRASLRFKWKITPTLQLTQNSDLYLQSDASNASVLTAVDTKLIGALKARFSYNVRYEEVLAKNQAIDTQSRATLVYTF